MSKFFYKCKNSVLAPIIANTVQEAEQLLETQHAWIKATKYNSTLIRVVSYPEYLPESHPDILGCMDSNY